MDCRDCNNCRISRIKGTIYCREKEWQYGNGSEKQVKLTDAESNMETNGTRIHDRLIFSHQKKCQEFVSYLE